MQTFLDGVWGKSFMLSQKGGQVVWWRKGIFVPLYRRRITTISAQFCVPCWSNEGWKRPATCWFILHVFASLCLSLRDAVSLFCRLQIDRLMILRKHARISLFLVHCLSKSTPQYGPGDMLFLLSPGRCLVIYGKGLALNSMEGSEAKHQAIFWNAFKTNFLNRWKQVFFHEFISAIWLQEKAYNLISASSCNKTYNPNRNFQSDHCYCGLPVADKRCEYCNSPCRTQITKSAQEMYVSNTRNG